MLELSAKIRGRDWFMAGKLEAIVLRFERKISLHSKSRGRGVEAEGVLWNGSLGLSVSCRPTSDAN